MRYRLSLGGRRIDNVISVSETVKNDIEQYQNLNGESFCQPTAKPLRCWNVELLADSGSKNCDDELIDELRDMRDSQKAQRLTVSSNVGGFSARVLLEEMKIKAGDGGSAIVSLRLLEYKKASLKMSDSVRVGSIGEPPESVMAGNAYQLIVRYQNAGENVRVVNPSTGAEVDNLAAVLPDMMLKAEKCIGSVSSTFSKLVEKKNKVLSSVYSKMKG